MKLLVGVVLLACLAASPATATAIYTSPGSFSNDTVNRINLGFNGILASNQLFASYNPLVVAGVSFYTPTAGASVNLMTADYYGAGYGYLADFIQGGPPNQTNQLNITFSTPLQAFGLYFGAQNGGGLGTFTLSDGTVYQDNNLPGLGVLAFVGFVAPAPITTVTFVTTNDSWIVEKLVLASPAPTTVTTPEPASGTLVLSAGAIALCAALRRRRRSARRS